MKPGGGNPKGGQFERKTCRRLSLWLSQGERSDLLWRSSQSGGRATIALRKGERLSSQAGDISLIDSAAQALLDIFVIECKHYKSLKIQNLIFGRKEGFPEFWKQVGRDAKRHNKLPLLIAKQNFYPELVGISSKGLECFNESIRDLKNTNRLRAEIPSIGVYILFLDDFLSFDPNDLDNLKSEV